MTSKEQNLDPITKTPGAHPVGTGVGAVAGGAAGIGAAALTGAAIGTTVGPVGTAIGAATGAVVGAVAGGLAGKAVAEHFDPTAEEHYWQGTYLSRPYYTVGMSYDDYAPAYRSGWESSRTHATKKFHEIEGDLERNWDKIKGKSRLKWAQAKSATHDAWERTTHHNKPATTTTPTPSAVPLVHS